MVFINFLFFKKITKIFSASEVPSCFLPRLLLDKKNKVTPPLLPERRRLAKINANVKRRQTTGRLSLGLLPINNGNVCRQQNRRTSLKRPMESIIPEEPVPTVKPVTTVTTEPVQARKHRRVTSEAPGALAAFGKIQRKQRRISDIMDVKRTSPVKTTPAKKGILSPRSAAMKKVQEMQAVMCPTPEKVMTRASSKLMSRTTNRRRTLA